MRLKYKSKQTADKLSCGDSQLVVMWDGANESADTYAAAQCWRASKSKGVK